MTRTSRPSPGRWNWPGARVAERNQLKRAVFLDRDGTICEEMGYLNHITRFVMYPFAPAAIRRLNKAGIPVVVVTNHQEFSRRIFPTSLVDEVHAKDDRTAGC